MAYMNTAIISLQEYPKNNIDKMQKQKVFKIKENIDGIMLGVDFGVTKASLELSPLDFELMMNELELKLTNYINKLRLPLKLH